MLVELHMRSRLLANLFTGCILFEVTGRKGDCTHAWAFPASALVTLEMARCSLSPRSWIPLPLYSRELLLCGIPVGLETRLWST